MSSFEENLNREILQRMREGGDSLLTPRPIDFSHVFPDESAATAFSAAMESQGFTTVLEETGCESELPWDVVVTISMIPDLQALTATELDLNIAAAAHRGRADGWGCERLTG